MGLGFLGDIVKGIKGIFSGIGKVFEAILKPIGKILDTSWGKAIMLAVSVFTFGSALLAGGQAFLGALANPQVSFLGSFVEGGKAFVGSLLGTPGEKGLAEGGRAGIGEAATEQTASLASRAVTEGVPGVDSIMKAGAENINAAGDLVAGGNLAGGGALSGAAAAATGAGANAGQGPTAALAKAGGDLAQDQGNWLSRAARSAWDFAKTDAGQNIIGSALEGYAAGERDKGLYEHQSRYDRMWQDPRQTQPIRDISEGFQPEIPGIWNRDPTAIANQRNRDYRPSVQYSQAVPGA